MNYLLFDTLQIIEISEREQSRISQDLHDSLGQILTGIAFISKMLEQKLAAKSLDEADHAAEITKLAKDAISQTRSLVKTLNPARLDADGLIFALEELAYNTSKIFGISCKFICTHPFCIQGNMVAKNLYRIVQEAINNAIKHGKAKHIIITLNSARNLITLAVRDDGIGIPLNGDSKEGMGLKIMKCRAQSIGASLTIERAPGGGTLISCSLKKVKKGVISSDGTARVHK